ncbi:MAG: acyl-CoA/acyl-ACP dehydrogenase [Gammaproteobacteria bacterium]|nr:acyl-CoA/acyl-ACP dehydrogenase [Gammaproteobacteria bacterium]MDH3371925.1 acyl-CoA/acyl-ACP dehydrogenase [Gammaproteobacteria bacterium]MDH3407746.1 acyl-CoA/acyl-ACP dehydrogenase [Gammaproteobacteria bacterium]MDH3551135.1 acyl-CoA/acyl-ACP dehydrogenase [Gammaproteobacteria bacterium]
MEFRFSEEQQMIRDTAASFLAEVSDSQAVRQAMANGAGYDESLWSRITEEMFWHAVHIPEKLGGLDLGYVELVAMLEQMGRCLTCSPFFSTVCLGVNALRVAGTEAQQKKYLAQIAGEGRTATLAWTGKGRRWDAKSIDTTYTLTKDGVFLDGRLHYVTDGHTADLLIIAARENGSSGEQGIGLFIVPAGAGGVSSVALPTMDQTRKQATISFDKVQVDAADIMRDAGDAWPLLSQVLDLARIATAADQTGGAERVLEMTVDYIKERRQFGRPVGSFQAMKHKAADMMLRAESARSALYYAACVADEYLAGRGTDVMLAEAASIAKAYCSEAYFFNAGCALQMHGGIGFTWEHDLHLYFKRAKSTQQYLGDASFHRERLARMILDAPT